LSIRAGAVIGLALIVLACGGTVTPGSSVGATGASGPAPTVDAARRDTLVAGGLPLEDATFLAATTYEVTGVDDRTARVVEQLASGDTIEFTVNVAPAQSGAAGDATFTSMTTDTEISVFMRHVVDVTTLPDDVRQALTAAAPREIAAIGWTPLLLAGESLIEVTINWILKKADSTIRDAGIEAVLKNIVPGQAGSLLKLIKAAFSVEKGIKITAELDALLTALDELEACAKEPTNPLTQQLYQSDPNAKQRLLDQIDEARSEIIANTVVNQLGVLNGFVAGYMPPNLKWMGYIMGPALAWSKETLDKINNDRLGEIQRAVPKCDCAVGLSSGGTGGGGSTGGGSTGGGEGGTSGGGTSGGGSGETCQFPYTWAGTVDYEIRGSSGFVFTLHATDVRWEWDPAVTGSMSSYKLVSARVRWTYDFVSNDGCLVEYHGSGTESGVPDEAASGGGEGGGPFLPAENANLTIRWIDIDPSKILPEYWGSAIVQLHSKIHFSDCNGMAGDHDPWALLHNVSDWFQLPQDPVSIIKEKRMSGTWTQSFAAIDLTWTWDFAPGFTPN
jgi:hypothetical protein